MNALFAALGITKQGFHQQLNRFFKRESLRKQVIHMVYQIRADHPTMCVRDMYYKLLPKGLGRDAFEAICRQEGLLSKRSKNWCKTTDSNGVIRFEDLTKDLAVIAINQLWQSDITYFMLSDRFYYITFIQDAFTKVIVGHQTSIGLSTEATTLAALKMALSRYKQYNLKGLIFHSDGGGQYYDKGFLAITAKMQLRNSMCEYAWENGMAERLNGVIKNNYLKHRDIQNFNGLTKEVDRSVLLYNNDKPHARLKRKTPRQVEKESLALQDQTKPTMTESLNAKPQSEGASGPNRLNQTKPRNQDVLSATIPGN
jgi:putative transposase